jgi:DNA-binding NarL/FixJ family response regulator
MGPTTKEASTGKILIVDDHQVVLSGTIGILREHYPTYEIVTAKTAQEALEQLANHHLSLAILDLSIPEAYQQDAKVETGIELLRKVMKHYPNQNIAVQSTYMLTFAFHEGLQDKAIAQELNVQPSTIRHYWNKLYDVLEIDPEVDKKEGKNLRSLTEIRARERGLLD